MKTNLTKHNYYNTPYYIVFHSKNQIKILIAKITENFKKFLLKICEQTGRVIRHIRESNKK